MVDAALKDEYYTYADYAAWDTDARYELFDGAPRLMSPAPSVLHQEITGALYAAFLSFSKGKPCRALISPIDVRLNADDADDTVLQPDMIVVCDRSKIGTAAIKGAPDLVIEVLSPSSERYDSGAKLDKYLNSGVRECWIVNPEAHTVRVYKSDDGQTETSQVYGEPETIPVGVVQGLNVSLSGIFAAAAL
jgi:Uma2 family endonuclease